MGFEDNPSETWDRFKACAAFFNMMTQYDLYTVYNAKLGDFQDVLCPTKMELVATHNHLMLMTMKKFELQSNAMARTLIMTALECCVPWDKEEVEKGHLPGWVFVNNMIKAPLINTNKTCV